MTTCNNNCGHPTDFVQPWPHDICTYCYMTQKYSFKGSRPLAANFIVALLDRQSRRCALTGRDLNHNDFNLDIIDIGGDREIDNFQLIVNEAMRIKYKKQQTDVLSLAADIAEHNSLNASSPISTSPTCGISEVIQWKGNALTKKFIESIPVATRLEITGELHKFFLNYDFTRVSYTSDVIDRDIEAITSRDIEVRECDGVPTVSNSGTIGTKMLKSFFPNVMKTRSGKKKSVYGCVTDPVMLYQICYNRMANYPFLTNKATGGRDYEYFNITPAMIIQGAKSSGLASMGSTFKATISKAIYKHFVNDGDVVYDYSAGFGARMLGMYATGIEARYYTAEPNTETYENLCKLDEFLGMGANIINDCSENIVLGEKIDFAFSSPPYFTHEIYCDEATQSAEKFPDYEEWLEGYWRATVQNIGKMSKDSTVFGINVGNLANSKMAKYHRDMIKIVKEEGWVLSETWNMETARSHFSKIRTPKLEPILFFKRL